MQPQDARSVRHCASVDASQSGHKRNHCQQRPMCCQGSHRHANRTLQATSLALVATNTPVRPMLHTQDAIAIARCLASECRLEASTPLGHCKIDAKFSKHCFYDNRNNSANCCRESQNNALSKLSYCLATACQSQGCCTRQNLNWAPAPRTVQASHRSNGNKKVENPLALCTHAKAHQRTACT